MRSSSGGRGSDWPEGETRVDSGQGQLSLIAETGPLRGRIYGSDGASMTIGRDDTCAVVLPIVESSRRHSRIDYRGGRFWVTDLGSLNGTRVNEQLIDQPGALDDGDRVTVSGQVFRVFLGKVEGSELVKDRAPRIQAPSADPIRIADLDGAPIPRASAAVPRKAWLWMTLVVIASAGAVSYGVVRATSAREQAHPPIVAPVAVPAPILVPTPAPVPPRPRETPPADRGAATALLEAVDAVSLVADGALTVSKIPTRGAMVKRDEVVVLYRKARPDAEEKQRRLDELQAKYGASAEHADFIAAAQKEAAEARAGRVHGVLRAPVDGIVISDAVKVGAHVRAGGEVLRVAARLRLVTTVDAIEGDGPECKAVLRDHADVALSGLLEPSSTPARVLVVSTLPEGLPLGALGPVRVVCAAR